RKFHHFGFEQPVADDDGDFGAGLGVGGLDIAHAEADLHAGRHRARGYAADLRAVGSGDRVAVARNAAVDHLEAHELALDPFGLEFLHVGAVDELLSVYELGDPA